MWGRARAGCLSVGRARWETRRGRCAGEEGGRACAWREGVGPEPRVWREGVESTQGSRPHHVGGAANDTPIFVASASEQITTTNTRRRFLQHPRTFSPTAPIAHLPPLSGLSAYAWPPPTPVPCPSPPPPPPPRPAAAAARHFRWPAKTPPQGKAKAPRNRAPAIGRIHRHAYFRAAEKRKTTAHQQSRTRTHIKNKRHRRKRTQDRKKKGGERCNQLADSDEFLGGVLHDDQTAPDSERGKKMHQENVQKPRFRSGSQLCLFPLWPGSPLTTYLNTRGMAEYRQVPPDPPLPHSLPTRHHFSFFSLPLSCTFPLSLLAPGGPLTTSSQQPQHHVSGQGYGSE